MPLDEFPPIHVLIIGSGTVGSQVLRALTSSRFKLRVRPFLLVRPSTVKDVKKHSALDELTGHGVTLLQGDLQDGVTALTELLLFNTIHTIVSCVGTFDIHLQLPLVEAAKAAGCVRHFIPSEFGINTNAVPSHSGFASVTKSKLAVQHAIRAAGLDCTLIYVTAFSEYLVDSPLLGVDLKSFTITAPASFDTHLCLAPLEDVGVVAAYAVVDETARNSTLYVGERLSYSQIADILDRLLGRRLERRVKTVEELRQALTVSADDFVSRIALVYAEAWGTHWPIEQTYLYQKQKGKGDYQATSFETFAKRVLGENQEWKKQRSKETQGERKPSYGKTRV